MVILTALFCEYIELSPISPVELLRGLAGSVSSYSGTCHFHARVAFIRATCIF